MFIFKRSFYHIKYLKGSPAKVEKVLTDNFAESVFNKKGAIGVSLYGDNQLFIETNPHTNVTLHIERYVCNKIKIIKLRFILVHVK